MIRKIMKALEPVVDAELERAQWNKGKTFASPHEGYAILKEEIEECTEALAGQWTALTEIWKAVRDDRDIADEDVWSLHCMAMETAAEAVQVAAMCVKMIKSMHEWEEEGEKDDEE